MKRVAETSRAAYADLQSSRGARLSAVLEALGEYRAARGCDPTAYELLRWMQRENRMLDLNGVRPRLTELKDAGRARTSGKRTCSVTEKRVYTWAAVTPTPVSVQYVDQRSMNSAAQEALF
jgi:hypothetical protein